MSAYTPGPWEWVVSPSGSIRLQTPDRGHWHVMTFARKGMRGAQPRFRSGPREIMMDFDKAGGADHPDARLISAAPDMYEALKVAVRVLDAGTTLLHDLDAAIQQMRAALAKAGQ